MNALNLLRLHLTSKFINNQTISQTLFNPRPSNRALHFLPCMISKITVQKTVPSNSLLLQNCRPLDVSTVKDSVTGFSQLLRRLNFSQFSGGKMSEGTLLPCVGKSLYSPNIENSRSIVKWSINKGKRMTDKDVIRRFKRLNWYFDFKMVIESEFFGVFKDPESGEEKDVTRYILKNTKGIIVKILSFGATLNSIEVPDKRNKSDHVILGFNTMEGYTNFNYIGTTIGRYGNRINKGKFEVNGKAYQLTINNNGNHLHGGKRGWDKNVWKSFINDDKLTFTHQSPDGDQGYPGDVMAQVTYSLEEDGSLKIDYQAISSLATPINMTNHAFFNLAGHGSGQRGLFEHNFEVLADCYLPVSSDLIPTGVIKSVEETPYDLRLKKNVKEYLDKVPNNGFDHCFCFSQKKRGTLDLAAVFSHPPSGRKLEVFTSEPAVQVYTGNFLPKEEGKMVGRGVSYNYQGAFCCEPQNYPDAMNQAKFPNSVLLPGEVYKHSVVFRFTTES